MIVEYDSNNSGGGWWLKDEDWLNLEKAGWTIKWYKDQTQWGGRPYIEGRFLGALASNAEKEFTSPKEAIREFEEITGEDASAGGCSCCGPPHSFSWDDEDDHDYVSGEGVLRILHDLEEVPTLREMVEKLKKESQ